MLYRVIDAVELPALVSAFMESYEVVAPVKRGGSHVFEVIQSPDDMDLSYATTIASPKKYFLPPVETLMTFDAQDNGVTDYAAEITPRVVFGAHDARAGCCGSVYRLTEDARLGLGGVPAFGGVLAGECAALLRGFYARRRERET